MLRKTPLVALPVPKVGQAEKGVIEKEMASFLYGLGTIRKNLGKCQVKGGFTF